MKCAAHFVTQFSFPFRHIASCCENSLAVPSGEVSLIFNLLSPTTVCVELIAVASSFSMPSFLNCTDLPPSNNVVLLVRVVYRSGGDPSITCCCIPMEKGLHEERGTRLSTSALLTEEPKGGDCTLPFFFSLTFSGSPLSFLSLPLLSPLALISSSHPKRINEVGCGSPSHLHSRDEGADFRPTVTRTTRNRYRVGGFDENNWRRMAAWSSSGDWKFTRLRVRFLKTPLLSYYRTMLETNRSYNLFFVSYLLQTNCPPL